MKPKVLGWMHSVAGQELILQTQSSRSMHVPQAGKK